MKCIIANVFQVTSDVKFCVEGRIINAHKAILKIRFVRFNNHEQLLRGPILPYGDLNKLSVLLFFLAKILIIK